MTQKTDNRFPEALEFGCGLATVIFLGGVSLALVVRVWTWIN